MSPIITTPNVSIECRPELQPSKVIAAQLESAGDLEFMPIFSEEFSHEYEELGIISDEQFVRNGRKHRYSFDA